MKKIQVLSFFLVSLISFVVQAECPYDIKDATVMLVLPNQTNLKITSTAMCNQKTYFADRFSDADVELWKKGKLIGKFYSRRVSYDVTTLKLILQNTALLNSDIMVDEKFKNTKLVFMDLKKGKLNTSVGEVRF